MSDLEKALEGRKVRTAMPAERVERYDSVIIPTHHWEALKDAARRWANLTSPETIEKGADAVEALPYDTLELRNWGEEGVADPYRIVAEAVLRSVEEGKT